jgi:two-component system response regulator MprA
MSSAGPRILVVEDDGRLLSVLEDVLRAEGYELRSARDGIAAIRQMLSFRPEVVLLDLEMPGMNGHEFMAWMVEQNVQIPVIIASCNDDAAADFATAATLSKPYDLDQLLKAVTAIVPSPRDKS